GFSFADEHILSLVQRALSNPSLTMYVMCYDESTKDRMSEIFRKYPNVKLIYSEDRKLDFTLFNDEYFTVNKLNKPMPEETMKPMLEAVVGGVK
ncbi:hypothetical protein KKJ14_20960, partial [Xenorhabdus bovienii]|nr:hypothetical protein [Xenorhabdus bovienii]MDE9590029.1 hypothetical protein [Xenorhabdus bovienii]